MVNRQDHNWGFTAFTNEALATTQQRLRAAQRVQIETLFEYISWYTLCEPEDNPIGLCFDALKALELDSKDLPEGQTNAARALFGKVLQIYLEARKQDQSLVDPDHGKFQGDLNNIPIEIKNNALEEVLKDFKAAWRI